MSYNWVSSSSHSGVPPNAVLAGSDIDGSPIYVGRAFHEGDLIPAKVIPSKQAAYVAHGGNEVPKHQFEVLCGTGVTWIGSASGHVPENAVCAGNQADGQPLYVGRAHIRGSLTPGKVHASHGCLYVPFDGSEHRMDEYEVLVAPQRSTWISTSAHGNLPEGAVLAGHDQDGAPLYVGRASHNGDLLPAKVLPTKRVAYVAHGGSEHAKYEYEVLCNGSVSWEHSDGASRTVPHFAVTGGQTSDGEPLFIGRAHYNGSLTVGKVQVSHGVLYIPFDGAEIPVHQYEVLVEH